MTTDNSRTFRKDYLDNIRSFTIALVVVYHVAYTFNSAGVISNIPVQGIPAVDSICYFLYPWFMCLMFLIAGISSRYALKKRTPKEFAKERAAKLLVPFLGGTFILAWMNGWVTAQYVDFFGGKSVPAFFKYLVYCMNIGPLWFLLELFAASMILLLIRAIDKKDKLLSLCERTPLLVVVLLVIPVWGSSYLLNTPVVVVFRNGIYWFMFLLGYYVFSHERILEELRRYCVPLLAAAVILGVIDVWYFFGQNYASDSALKHPLTNLYLWTMILAVLGCSQRWLNRRTAFTEFLKKRSFALYVFHYPFLVIAAYYAVTVLRLPMAANYPLLLIYDAAVSLLAYELVSRIPLIRYLLLGIRKKKAEGRTEKA